MNTAVHTLSTTTIPGVDPFLEIVWWLGGIILSGIVACFIACIIACAIDDPRGERTESIVLLVGIPMVLINIGLMIRFFGDS